MRIAFLMAGAALALSILAPGEAYAQRSDRAEARRRGEFEALSSSAPPRLCERAYSRSLSRRLPPWLRFGLVARHALGRQLGGGERGLAEDEIGRALADELLARGAGAMLPMEGAPR